ncbi:SDR family oxidoreductase [Algoriphagus machipongonensis]|uniref:Short-chain dehydrogenase/reductase family oxidoreductase n=1 Tax=Algoriphagus machipongonensis TaxID=388413 RepID=A3HWV9_9BACT|nr:SDR family oxidoreductase [Algoriphagus machipongonensis]EAZ81082.1 short-chain dehydrogenase/reductase family oxidoreductase [Algoriphagus machipongonensis]
MKHKILVTGASGAFGSLACIQLAENGHQVVGTMRSLQGKNEPIANELKSKGVSLVKMDVTNEESVNSGIKSAIELMDGLDTIFNNAGIGANGILECFTSNDIQKMFDINVFGVQRLMRAVLPHLRQQGKGTIIHTSSCIGRVTTPFLASYSASKYALESLAEGYRAELSGFGIESCIVEPGGFPTGFMSGMITPSDTERMKQYGEMASLPETSINSYVAYLESIPEQRPERVAEAIVKLVNTPFGEKPFRKVVDFSGIKQPIENYNKVLNDITKTIYTANGVENLLTLNKD